MRTAIFSLLMLAAPALLGQSAVLLAPSPGAPWSSPSGNLTVLTPQTQTGWTQHSEYGWQTPLLAQNRSFTFAKPSPQAPAGKMEPIPTQWPGARFEGIPTRWQTLKVVPAGTAGTAAIPASTSTTQFVQASRK